MRFDILTLFPEAFESFCTTSIIGRAVKAGQIEINCYNIRDFSTNKHHKVDDIPYGGGAGMVMMCQPLFDSIEHVKGLVDDDAPVVFFTPHGQNWSQIQVEKIAQSKTIPNKYTNSEPRYILVCGHYEGIDQRVRDQLIDLEISLGSYILTGGELPAQIFIDSITRLLPGVIGDETSHQEESFSESIGRDQIEYPHYTRPENFRGLTVPPVLLSGHHAQIEAWRRDQCTRHPEV